MKAGSFNIHDYLGKLYEEINEEDLGKILNEEEEGGKVPETEGIIIPDGNKKAYDWLKREYQKGKTEVKVEMSSHEFKPGYHMDTNLKSVQDFKPEMSGQIKTGDTPKGGLKDKAIPFPETKFPGSGETKAPVDDKIGNTTPKQQTISSEKTDGKKEEGQDKDKLPKVEYRTKKDDEKKKENKK